MRTISFSLAALLLAASCTGEDGDRGTAGADGATGTNGTDGSDGSNRSAAPPRELYFSPLAAPTTDAEKRLV